MDPDNSPTESTSSDLQFVPEYDMSERYRCCIVDSRNDIHTVIYGLHDAQLCRCVLGDIIAKCGESVWPCVFRIYDMCCMSRQKLGAKTLRLIAGYSLSSVQLAGSVSMPYMAGEATGGTEIFRAAHVTRFSRNDTAVFGLVHPSGHRLLYAGDVLVMDCDDHDYRVHDYRVHDRKLWARFRYLHLDQVLAMYFGQLYVNECRRMLHPERLDKVLAFYP